MRYITHYNPIGSYVKATKELIKIYQQTYIIYHYLPIGLETKVLI